jgi:hypothetical protein
MDAMNRMPGDAEADGAAAGMQETYGRRGLLPSVGDSIWFQHCVGAFPRPGRIEQFTDFGSLVVRDDAGDAHVIEASQLAEF